MPGKTLVIGATGQIGSELVPQLRILKGQENVVQMGHSSRPPTGPGPSVTADVMDIEGVSQIIKEHDITEVYHLAALLSAVGEHEPQMAWELNMKGLVNVLELARSHRLKVFWPSSIAVFGTGYPRDSTPQETVLLPTTMYGVTKVSGELLCSYYHRRYHVDVRSVRYPGIISSETPPGGGTTDYAVAIFYEAIRRKRYECFVRADTVLPMMYMPDCLNAAVSIMKADIERIGRRDAYNLNSMSFSAADLAQEITKHIPDMEVRYTPDFRQGIADTWPRSLDDSEARKDWGWSPEWGLERMTSDMLEKLRKRLSAESS
ncbi:MAG: GDP-mannose 4,6-dehydratase [Methanomassiliicoccales archaeon PtaU1.Bin124]|nr:MAG: GDP-mannose 4,6-dehydratase [Methanomassiliicoccales archaeon PtaU1.Bin124]